MFLKSYKKELLNAINIRSISEWAASFMKVVWVRGSWHKLLLDL